ncbi:MAG: HlyD family efflux transporter periplasmic adaptor subunit [Paracoccaceae bacterium]
MGRIVPVIAAYTAKSVRAGCWSCGHRLPARWRRLAPGFEDGTRVAAGQLLLRLDPAAATAARDLALNDRDRAVADRRDAEQALDLAREDLAVTEAQEALRRAALERRQSLRASGAVSEAAVEEAELAASAAAQAVVARRQALASAEARLGQAVAAADRAAIALAEAERDLAETSVYAGFSGVLSDVSAIAGGLVGTNERLARLVDPDALDVSFRLSTAQFARLVTETGSLAEIPVTVALDVLGLDILAQGRIARVSAEVGEGQSGRLVHATLDAAPGFRPGDFVAVRVEEPALDDVAILPASAVDGQGTVLALGDDDRLEVVSAPVLRRQGDSVIVEARALAGREVVSERSPLLGAGIKVRPNRAGAPAASSEPEMVTLDPERRARLIAFVEANTRMPAEARERVLAQLREEAVPAQVVARIEERMGG